MLKAQALRAKASGSSRVVWVAAWRNKRGAEFDQVLEMVTKPSTNSIWKYAVP